MNFFWKRNWHFKNNEYVSNEKYSDFKNARESRKVSAEYDDFVSKSNKLYLLLLHI